MANSEIEKCKFNLADICYANKNDINKLRSKIEKLVFCLINISIFYSIEIFLHVYLVLKL